MSAVHEYRAQVQWRLAEGQSFKDNRYPRAHQWRFDGGVTVPASSAPNVVPPPLSASDAVDPEEAFVASLSSCHMLFFLFHAARQGYVVTAYDDEAVGQLGKNAQGRTAMLKVTLRPALSWDGAPPDAATLRTLHDKAHHDCYIANSVTTEVLIEPR